jgi:hypothetical protein
MNKYIPNTFKQYLALLLCAAMLLPLIPVTARATGNQQSSAPINVQMSVVDQVCELYTTASGNISETLVYDGGNDVSAGGEKSYLTVVTGTTASEFSAYMTALSGAGYELKSTRTTASKVQRRICLQHICLRISPARFTHISLRLIMKPESL